MSPRRWRARNIVNGRADMPLRVLLNGKDGKIGEMPPLGQSLSDKQLAAVLTYVRGSFGNTASPVIGAAGAGISACSTTSARSPGPMPSWRSSRAR